MKETGMRHHRAQRAGGWCKPDAAPNADRSGAETLKGSKRIPVGHRYLPGV